LARFKYDLTLTQKWHTFYWAILYYAAAERGAVGIAFAGRLWMLFAGLSTKSIKTQ